jgi:glutathione synthase/RimK-type ligase-like ATP-grasp enzyme
MILLITSKRDGHIDAVSRHLDDKEVPWVRINVEDFATNVQLTVTPTTGTGRITVQDSGRSFELDEVRAVWYRKPEPVNLSHLSLDPAALEYVEAEFTEVLLGLYGLLSHAYWINNPLVVRAAHRKLLQLQVASKVGFVVPETLVTNSRQAALDFAHSLGGDIAIKSLGAISVVEGQGDSALQYGIFTRRISITDLHEFGDKIVHMPTLFQRFIIKQCELRITCVGEKAFACKIEPRRNDLTSDDYRFDTRRLVHSAVEAPGLESLLFAYMRSLGLVFGCFDFAVSAAGQPVFLECNPNGQWRWVEEMTGLPIGAAIADELMRHCC